MSRARSDELLDVPEQRYLAGDGHLDVVGLAPRSIAARCRRAALPRRTASGLRRGGLELSLAGPRPGSGSAVKRRPTRSHPSSRRDYGDGRDPAHHRVAAVTARFPRFNEAANICIYKGHFTSAMAR